MENNPLLNLAWERWESVWQGVMRADQLAWLEVQSLQAIQRAVQSSAPYGPLTREAFLGLYAQSPGRVAAPVPALRLVHQLLGQAEDLPEWQGLRSDAAEDPLSAAFGAAHFSLALLAQLPEEVRAALQAAAEPHQTLAGLHDQIEQLQALGDQLAHTGQPAPLEAQLAELRADLEAVQARQAATEQAAQQALAAASARTRQACAAASASAMRELNELQHAAQAFGLGWGAGRGPGGPVQLEALARLHEFLQGAPLLRQILNELGWARRLLAEQVRQAQRGRESLTHYQTGPFQPEDLAPEEWTGLMLDDPASPLAMDFLARCYDDDLLHRRCQGPEAAGRGPIVFVRDTSGSMQSPPLRHAIAAAVALALMQWARQEQRRFVSIPFSGPGQWSLYDPGPHPDLAELLAHLSFGYWGGTEPYGPLQAAMEQIRSDPALRQGDILILTDGAFGPAPEAFRQACQAARLQPGLRLVAVVIGPDPGALDFADRVVRMDDLVRDRQALAQALAAVVQP